MYSINESGRIQKELYTLFGFCGLPSAKFIEGFLFMQNTGQIVRSRKTAKDTYTPISNEILQSKELTCEEKSILVHLLSLPSDWVVYKNYIWRDMNIGRDRFNKHWKGLVEKGFIVSIRVIDVESNLIKGWNHIVYEVPVLPDEIEEASEVVSDLLKVSTSEGQAVNKVITIESNNITKLDEVESDEKVKQITFDDLPDTFKPHVSIWLQYKKQRKEEYKSDLSKAMLFKRILKDFSNEKELEISVEYSISNNWQGLFKQTSKKPLYTETKTQAYKKLDIND